MQSKCRPRYCNPASTRMAAMLAGTAALLMAGTAHADDLAIRYDLGDAPPPRTALADAVDRDLAVLPETGLGLPPPARVPDYGLHPTIDVHGRIWTPEDLRARKTARTLEYTFHALNLVDGLLTARCLGNSSCHEVNPLLGRNPSPMRLVSVKLLTSAVHFLGYRSLIDQHPKQARTVNYISVGLLAGVTGMGLAVNF